MESIEDILTLEDKMQYLRDKLNSDISKSANYRDIEEYEEILSVSRQLDIFIVKYIKSSNKQIFSE